MVVNLNNINKIFRKIFSIIIIIQIFNFIKTETSQESINKSQTISRITYIGDIYYRYMNFASYSNGDMVVETTCYPENRGRMFYGLKANGRPFFKDKSNNKETPYYSINVEGENFKSLEGEGIIIKLSNNEDNGKEYFFSISKMACNTELFDFDNDKVFIKLTNTFINNYYDFRTLRSAIIPLSKSITDDKYYYIFGFVSKKWYSLSGNKFLLQKHKFETLNEYEDTNTYTEQYIESDDSSEGYQTSCFQTVNGLINCFYSTTNYNKDIFYNILKTTIELSDKKVISFQSEHKNEDSFLKCIHLKDEVGVYAYYSYKSNSYYPVFLFKEFNSNNDSFIDYLPSFEISKNNFIKNLLINDLIKLTESKIVFSSVIEDKTIVYIILINIFGDKKLK